MKRITPMKNKTTPIIPGTIPGAEYGFALSSLNVGILIDKMRTANPNKNKNIEVKKSALFMFSCFI
jgi:hypothetical protein